MDTWAYPRLSGSCNPWPKLNNKSGSNYLAYILRDQEIYYTFTNALGIFLVLFSNSASERYRFTRAEKLRIYIGNILSLHF